jgi:hypothetical protein
LAKANGSAATNLMCDLARYHNNAISMDDIRKHWAKGKYAGAPEEWAIAAIEHAKRQKK